MKIKATAITLLVMAGAMTCTETHGADTSSYNYQFRETSVLGKGKWVKIEVTRSGVYEISYTELRSMGFGSPEKVSVFGAGGKARSSRLIDGGRRTQSDDPEQKPVMHLNNKLYFWGQGVEEVTYGARGFERQSFNIYTKTGHYYLTDSAEPMLMESVDAGTAAAAVDRSRGVGYVYTEEDRMHGLDNDGYGQNYWDWQLAYNPSRAWNPYLEMAADNCKARVNVGIAPSVTENVNDHLLKVTVNTETKSAVLPKGTMFGLKNYSLADFNIGSLNKVVMSIGVEDAGAGLDMAYLDYWVMNYDKDLHKAPSTLVSEELGVEGNVEGGTGYVTVPAGCKVWDVSDAEKPAMLEMTGNNAYFAENEQPRHFIIFDPAKEQKRVANPVYMDNQNLHALQNEPYSLIIVTLPKFRTYAQQIADLHEQYDGIKVLVVTPQECYDEFTSGNMDPNAIRMLAKMIYQSAGNGKKLRNILLLGEMRINTRDTEGRGLPDEYIIAVHEGGYMSTRKPGLGIDMYGMMADKTNTGSNLFNQELQLGVGSLHISTEEEARLAVTKIRTYLEGLADADMAWMVNETLAASCTGDKHLHDEAVRTIEQTYGFCTDDIGTMMVHNTVMPDFYPGNQARGAFLESYNRGQLFTHYIGHANAVGLGGYLTGHDVMNGGGKVPGFFLFAGCDLTLPDFNESGVGSDIVLRTAKGAAGSFASCRTAWSTNNLNLSQFLIRGMFYSNPVTAVYRKTSPTIGEIYASCKTEGMNNFNELSYLLVGDPALTVPVPLQAMTHQTVGDQTRYTVGDIITVKGAVLKNGKTDTGFNGKAVIKLCAPTTTRYQVTYPQYSYLFAAEQLASAEAEVIDGEYTIRVAVPASAEKYMTGDASAAKMLNMYLAAYDPTTRQAGSVQFNTQLCAVGQSSDGMPEKDVTKPELNIEYDAAARAICVNVSDDLALVPGLGNGGAVYVEIDGRQMVNEDAQPGMGVSSYSTMIGVGHLGEGEHILTSYATDMAGNIGPRHNFRFTVGGEEMPQLTAEHVYGIEDIAFGVSGNVTDTMRIIIRDKKGATVVDEPCGADGYVWQCAGSNPGEYTAVLRDEKSPLHSSRVLTFHVLE